MPPARQIAKQVTVPGFRKGHVPGKIIDQRIGFAAVAGEAVNNGVPELYSKALEEKKIRPMSQPEIDVQEVPTSAKDETKPQIRRHRGAAVRTSSSRSSTAWRSTCRRPRSPMRT